MIANRYVKMAAGSLIAILSIAAGPDVNDGSAKPAVPGAIQLSVYRKILSAGSSEIRPDLKDCGFDTPMANPTGTITISIKDILKQLYSQKYADRAIGGKKKSGSPVVITEPNLAGETPTNLDMQIPQGWAVAGTYAKIIVLLENGLKPNTRVKFLPSAIGGTDSSDAVRAGVDDAGMFCGRSVIKASPDSVNDAVIEIGVVMIPGQAKSLGSLNIGLVITTPDAPKPSDPTQKRTVALPIILDPKVGNDG